MVVESVVDVVVLGVVEGVVVVLSEISGVLKARELTYVVVVGFTVTVDAV